MGPPFFVRIQNNSPKRLCFVAGCCFFVCVDDVSLVDIQRGHIETCHYECVGDTYVISHSVLPKCSPLSMVSVPAPPPKP